MNDVIIVRGIVHDAIQIVHPLSVEKQIDVVDATRETHTAVLGNATLARQIVSEFLFQLIRGGKARHTVHVDVAASDGDRIVIRVSCANVQVNLDMATRSFGDGHTLNGARGASNNHDITMAQCRRWARDMNGRAGADELPGGGLLLWLELRAAAVAQPVEETPAAAPALTLSATVLYVEDNAANRRLMESIFRSQAHLSLVCATTAEQGLELLLSYQPHVLLVDIHLPGMNGFDMVRAMRRAPEGKDIPAIALSADAAPDRWRDAENVGMFRYLAKPVDIPDLLDTINGALALRSVAH